MRRLLTGVVLVSILHTPRIAAACQPCDDRLSLATTASRADLVVVAIRVADDAPLDGGEPYVTYAPFDVRRTLKGTPTATRILVAIHFGMCYAGVDVERLAPSVLFLEKDGDTYTVVRDGCAVTSLPMVDDKVVLSDISLPVDTFARELGLLPPLERASELPIRLGVFLLSAGALVGLAFGVWVGRRASR